MKKRQMRFLCLLSALLLLSGCVLIPTIPTESGAPQTETTEAPADCSHAISWSDAFNSTLVPEGTISPDEIAFYSVDKRERVSVVNVPLAEVLDETEHMEYLPRTHYYEKYLPETLLSLLPILDYAMAHHYCQISIPSTEYGGKDVRTYAQFLSEMYRISFDSIFAMTQKEFELDGGEKLQYVHITILGLNHWELVEKHMSAMEVAEKLLDSVPEEADEVETALYLYQWLTDHVRYDSYDYYDNEGWNLLYDTLVERKTVCSGYTEALYYLFNMAGIECITIKGFVPKDGAGEFHIWNIAKINGEYFQFDATWDAGVSPKNYRYFGISDTLMQSYAQRTIDRESMKYVPTCTKCIFARCDRTGETPTGETLNAYLSLCALRDEPERLLVQLGLTPGLAQTTEGDWRDTGVTDSEMKQALAEYMSDEVIGSFCEGFFKTDGVRLLCAAAPKEAPLYVTGRVELVEDGALYAVCYSETEDGFYIPAFFSFTVKNSKLNTITQIVEETQA